MTKFDFRITNNEIIDIISVILLFGVGIGLITPAINDFLIKELSFINPFFIGVGVTAILLFILKRRN